jgi:high affinity Mn2+ porin
MQNIDIRFAQIRMFILLCTVALTIGNFTSASSQTHPSAVRDSVEYDWMTSHFQFTSVLQKYAPFQRPAYTGRNSLQPENPVSAMTVTATMFLGVRLFRNVELYWNPEIAGGGGVNGVVGLGGFVNGEAVRVGDPKPSLYTARLFVRGHIGLDDVMERSEDDANQIVGYLPKSRITITAGRINLLDIFDEDDQLSFDPRMQFLNWSLVAPGGWDFAADTRGYTYGVVAELHQPGWQFNLGWTMVPNDANGAVMDFNLANAYTLNAEFVKPFSLGEKRGTLHLIGFLNRALMGSYAQAIADGERNRSTPDITQQRSTYRTKYGFALTLAQELHKHITGFARASWNDGANETWMFTEIDRSVALGAQIDGAWWKRPFDGAGVAVVSNGLSRDHQRYLAAGGSGFMLGDGRLNYTSEMIFETYYNYMVTKGLFVSPNYQMAINPGYNADRSGPVHFFALRIHAEFGESR